MRLSSGRRICPVVIILGCNRRCFYFFCRSVFGFNRFNDHAAQNVLVKLNIVFPSFNKRSFGFELKVKIKDFLGTFTSDQHPPELTIERVELVTETLRYYIILDK